jgi:hypothetical protein
VQGKVVSIELPNGAELLAEVTELEPAGATKVADFSGFDFSGVGATLEGLAEAVNSSLEKVKPGRVGVELALKLGVKSGKLTGLLVEGQGEASIAVTLEWDNARAPRARE